MARKKGREKFVQIFLLSVCISLSSLAYVTIGEYLNKKTVSNFFLCTRKAHTHTNSCLAKSSEGFGFRFDVGKVAHSHSRVRWHF